MRVVLQYFDGCPNWRVADERLRNALRQVGEQGDIIHQVVDTPEHAARVAFTGSPTILIDGIDPFAAQAGAVGLTCRMYRTETRLEGAPSVEQLVAVLRVE